MRTQDERVILADVKAAMRRFVRNKDKPADMETLRYNLIVARGYAGMSAVEAAAKFGYKNSTQISLIESGKRPVPNDQRFLRQASQIYGVSCDWLLGLSPHPEIDSVVGRQYALMRGIQQTLLEDAAMRTSAMIQYTQQIQPTEQEYRKVEAAVSALVDAIDIMREKFGFDDIRGSAPVVKAAQAAREAMQPMRQKLAKFRGIEGIFEDFRGGRLQPIPHLLERYSQLDLLDGITG